MNKTTKEKILALKQDAIHYKKKYEECIECIKILKEDKNDN